MKKIQVAVLMGGTSTERNISLLSGKEIIRALSKEKKYQISIYDPKSDLLKLLKNKNKIDVAIPILHGPQGEDGAIQGFLESAKIPYTFSGVFASAVGMNKYIQKIIYEKIGIATPKYFLLDKDRYHEQLKKIPKSFFKKVVIKPNQNGSSYGVYIAKNFHQTEKFIKKAFLYDDQVLLEEYIDGTEITCGVLGNGIKARALPIVEIVPSNTFFDFKCKYDGSSREIVPARIPKTLEKKIKEYVVLIHRVLGCKGVTRTDIIIKNPKSEIRNPKIYVLEINTIPGFTKESLIPKAARAAGISFEHLVEKLVELAQEGQNVSEKT